MSFDQCQFCKDHELTNEELVYQSDHDYPSDVESLSEDDQEQDENTKDADGNTTEEPSEVKGDEKSPEEIAAENALIEEIFHTSDEEEAKEDADNKDPDKPKVRTKRDANHTKKHDYKGPRSSYVRMPTGKKFKISTPTPNTWSCSAQSKLIEIRRFGKYKKEYYIIKKELEKTKVYHPGYNFKEYKIIKIEKIVNGCLWKQYIHQQRQVILEAGYANQRMLFHGSTVVDDIALHGFNEQYASLNGMFGAGLYFAKNSSKANQYVFSSAKAGGCAKHQNMNCDKCERKMIICRVTLGRSKIEYTVNKYPHPPAKYHSVVGTPSNKPGGLKYAEYIVYRREQAYPEYVITYKTAN